MKPLQTLFPARGALSDEAADRAIAAAVRAFVADEPSAGAELSGPAAGCVERMRQAASKIASGVPLRRMGELITLAQFAAAPVGTLVSDACRDPAAAARCEGCFTAFFLIDVAGNVDSAPQMLPADVSARDVLDRAAAALRTPGHVEHKGLRRYLARRSARARRRIARLRKYGPGHPKAELGRLDAFLIAIRLFLRREPGS